MKPAKVTSRFSAELARDFADDARLKRVPQFLADLDAAAARHRPASRAAPG